MKRPPEGTVLLDAPSGGDLQFDVSFLERNQHPVIVCHGPAAATLCPLLAVGECAKYGDAHGVVFALDLDRPQHRAIVERYRSENPDLPIRVIATAEQQERFAGFLSTVEVWGHSPTVAELDGFAAEVEASDRSA